MSAVIPKFRFQCFQSDWSENKLSHFCYINPPKPIEPVDGKISFIPMNAVTEEAKLSYSETVSYKSYCKGFTGFQDGDAIFAKITPCFENGKGALLQGLVNGVGFGSTEFHVLRAKEGSSPSFIHYLLNTPKFRFVGERNMQGSAGQKRVTTDYLRAYKVYFPKSNLEQQKIADFLTSVDTKISQLTEKYRLLKDYKKGVMQQIFSQQIRFKDDDGNAFPEWNTHELAMLSESGISNGVFNDPKKVGKGFRLINVKDMYKGDSIEYSELTLLDLEPKLFEKNKVKYGDIFFTRSSIVPIGIAFSNVNLSEKEDITFDGHLMKISPNKKLVDPLFLAYYLRSHAPRKALVSRGKQSTMTTISQDDIKDIKLNMPALKEQKKIAQFLQSLDKKINAVNEQREHTKLFKKALLQQMFV
ncbi:restriction endonuclease subunit S [Pseudoalteromonas sp. TB64]|uniref:restriction endonuclease subunit S n=1 Tax=Pseudoalteromonas sp. TB64 TaxID=1938600 RepID=UPI0003FDCC4A|nr:restriction endonuclease subunit S [Pseudoalteromonas sp. TB64]